MDQNSGTTKSLLTNLRSHHVVKVFNPLSEDFKWQVARSVSELDTRYVDQTIDKLNLRNDMHPTMKHVSQTVTLPQGKALNLPGDVAQVIVKHLVDEIMNRRGHKSTIGDPDLRREIEEDVILNTEDLRSQLSNLTLEDQLTKQIEDLNRESVNSEVNEVTDEVESVTSNQPGVFGESDSGTTGEEAIFGGGDSTTGSSDKGAKADSTKRKV